MTGVSLQSVAVGYDGEAVLESVTAAAREGAITVVAGANAAGKSTLLRVLAGLAAPMRGTVRWIDGIGGGHSIDPAGLSPRRRAQRSAFLPQRIRLPAGFSVFEVVAMGRHALPPSRSRIESALERFALVSLQDRAVHTLSVGQQQRVGLARVAAQHEAGGLLILDEPFAPLDLRELHRAAGWLRAVAAAGATVVLSVHDLGLASRLANEVWLLAERRLEAAGPAGEVLARSRLESMFGAEAIDLALGGVPPAETRLPEAR